MRDSEAARVLVRVRIPDFFSLRLIANHSKRLISISNVGRESIQSLPIAMLIAGSSADTSKNWTI
jgi:hypothetical protein